jgi:hypothetical protein
MAERRTVVIEANTSGEARRLAIRRCSGRGRLVLVDDVWRGEAPGRWRVDLTIY